MQDLRFVGRSGEDEGAHRELRFEGGGEEEAAFAGYSASELIDPSVLVEARAAAGAGNEEVGG